MKNDLQPLVNENGLGRAYFLVGQGNLGRVIHSQLKGRTSTILFDRRDFESHEGLRQKIQTHLAMLGDDSELEVFVLLAVSDPAIEELFEHFAMAMKDLAPSCKRHFIHFSASKITRNSINCFHPLYSFTGRAIEKAEWDSVPFIYDSENAIEFQDVFPFWRNKCYRISNERGPLYHALAVSGGNLPFTLIQHATQILQDKFNLPKEAVLPFIHSLLRNFEDSEGPVATGPLGRKDSEALREQLKALEPMPLLHSVYEKTIEKHWPEFIEEPDV